MSAKLFEYNGQSKTLEEWGTEYNVKPRTIAARLQMGWTMEEALTRDPRTYHLSRRNLDSKVAKWERYAQRTTHLYQDKWGK